MSTIKTATQKIVEHPYIGYAYLKDMFTVPAGVPVIGFVHPVFDPGTKAICPLCKRAITQLDLERNRAKVITMTGYRHYILFYRCHNQCWNGERHLMLLSTTIGPDGDRLDKSLPLPPKNSRISDDAFARWRAWEKEQAKLQPKPSMAPSILPRT